MALNVAVTPEIDEALKLTAELKSLREAIAIVELEEPACSTVTADGLAEMEKSASLDGGEDIEHGPVADGLFKFL